MNRTYIQKGHLWNGKIVFQQWVRHNFGDVSLKYALHSGGMYDDVVKEYGPIVVNEYGGWHKAKDQYIYEHVSRSEFWDNDILTFPAKIKRTLRVNGAQQRRIKRTEQHTANHFLDEMLRMTDEMLDILKKDGKTVAQ